MDEKAWTTVLTEAGIEEESAKGYASLFAKERLSCDLLGDLDRSMLKELGVDRLGDALTILKIGKKKVEVPDVKKTSEPTTLHVYAKPPTAKPPEANCNMTHQEFRKFRIDWEVYLKLTNIDESQIHSQLYSCCDDEAQRALINTYDDFFKIPQSQLLSKLEAVVTQQSNPTVYRMQFANIFQHDESIQSYVVRLKSSAMDCEFSCPQCKYDISTQYIKDQLIRGLQNETLQTDILAKADQLKDLEKVVKHCEAFEAALRDQSKLQDVADVQAARSNYQKNKKQVPTSSAKSQEATGQQRLSCQGCGSRAHGASGANDRAEQCRAWGKECYKCHKLNHYGRMCRNKGGTSPNDSADMEALMAHVTFDIEKGTFVTTPETHVEQIQAFLTAFSPKRDPRPAHCIPNHAGTFMDIFPDSGATICLAGPQHLDEMGLQTKHLIKCKKVVRAVGGFKMTCIGWIPVEFYIGGQVTKQALYICNNIDRVYFSRPACKVVGIISSSYPFPMSADQPDGKSQEDRIDGEQAHAVFHQPSSLPSAKVPEDIKKSATSKLPRKPPPMKPDKLPFAPTAENIPKLKQYLVDKFEASAFNASAPFPKMPGPAAHIHLKEGAVPKARHSPIPVPFHFKKQVKESLDEDVEMGVIAPVPIGMATEWCSTMVIAAKKDGRPRRTVDLQHLNDQSMRETHHCESPFNLACQVPPNTYKTVLDAVDGYHAVALDEESQPLTTFITEWGRYMYLRMPQGFLASGDAYTRRYDEVIKDLPRKVKIVDDALLWDSSIEESFFHTWDLLTIGATNGIVFSTSKFQFCQQEVRFGGLNITDSGVAPSDSMLSAIKEFPVPKTLTDARSWFGLVNQVAWAYSVQPIMQPFRDLVKRNAKFQWSETLERAFIESRNMIVELVKEGIKAFDIKRTTALAPDWSKEGMGFLLLQKYCECPVDKAPVCCPDGWRLVFAGSRFCNPAESRYAPIEGEAAAIAYSLKKARMFVMGCRDLIVITDHEPLVSVLGDRELADITNPRLAKLKEKTLRYRFSIQHNPGKWHRGSDAVSRGPVEHVRAFFECIREEPMLSDRYFCDEIEASILAITCEAISDFGDEVGLISPDMIRAAGKSDETYLKLSEVVQEGFPRTRHLTDPLIRKFWEVRNRLTVDNGLIMMDRRIIIPSTFKKRILRCLHSAHQGCNGMDARANISIYWPGINADIRNYRQACGVCTEIAPSQPNEPLVLAPIPEWPFQRICIDLFELSNFTYVVIVDRYSGWPIIYQLKSGQADSKNMINICRQVFTNCGTAEELSSDGASIFESHAFQKFLKVWDVHHRCSSVEYAQSNGRAELGVKSAKRIIRGNALPNGSLDNDKFARAIMQYRNTPLAGIGLSPAQLYLHRQLRDFIPSKPILYKPDSRWIKAAEKREESAAQRNAKLIMRYNANANSLTPLDIGDSVAVQNKQKRWDKLGQVVEVLPDRQYLIKVDGSGRVTKRNRKFLRKIHPCLRKGHAFIPSPLDANTKESGPTQQESPEILMPNTPRRVSFADNSPLVTPRTSESSTLSDQTKQIPLALKRLADFNATPTPTGAPTHRLRGNRGKEDVE